MRVYKEIWRPWADLKPSCRARNVEVLWSLEYGGSAYRQAIACVFNSVYKTIARHGKYSWYVNKWTGVVVKVSYAINHHINYPDEKIPAK